MAHVALQIKIPQLAIRNKMWFVLMKEIVFGLLVIGTCIFVRKLILFVVSDIYMYGILIFDSGIFLHIDINIL